MPRLLLSGICKACQFQKFINVIERGNAKHPVLLFYIILRIHVKIDGRGLNDGAHPPADEGYLFTVVGLAVQRITAGGRKGKPADQAHQRGLSGAVFPDKAVDGPLRNMHGQPAQGEGIAVSFIKGIGCQDIVHSKYLLLKSLCGGTKE